MILVFRPSCTTKATCRFRRRAKVKPNLIAVSLTEAQREHGFDLDVRLKSTENKKEMAS